MCLLRRDRSQDQLASFLHSIIKLLEEAFLSQVVGIQPSEYPHWDECDKQKVWLRLLSCQRKNGDGDHGRPCAVGEGVLRDTRDGRLDKPQVLNSVLVHLTPPLTLHCANGCAVLIV